MNTLFLVAALFAAMLPGADTAKLLSQVDATRLIAGCVLKRDRAIAIEIAANDPTAPAFAKAAKRIEPALVACLIKADRRSLMIRVNDLRGTLAESLLKEADGAAMARARQLPVEPPRRISLGKSQFANDAALFSCVVGADPQQAASLVEAIPESVEEGAAFRALVPALQSCVPEGAEMHLMPFQIRLLVAASLYGRLAAFPGA